MSPAPNNLKQSRGTTNVGFANGLEVVGIPVQSQEAVLINKKETETSEINWDLFIFLAAW